MDQDHTSSHIRRIARPGVDLRSWFAIWRRGTACFRIPWSVDAAAERAHAARFLAATRRAGCDQTRSFHLAAGMTAHLAAPSTRQAAPGG